MASAAALLAVTALCLAPRIALAQGNPAPAAANTHDSLIDDTRTPVLASAAVNFSPEAGEAASSDGVPAATPKAAAIGSGPKLKTGRSWAVPGQPAVESAPPTPAVLAAPVAPAAPAPLTAQSAPLMSPGSILLSAAATPEPRPGRTPRRAQAESADSSFEERLERLEKMVESLMARKDTPPNPYATKRSADKVGSTDRKESAEMEARHFAEISRKLEQDEIEKFKEQEKREAARAADQAKRAAVDAEKVARAEQPIRDFSSILKLTGIAGGARPIATINNLTFAVGEEQEVRVEGGKLKIRVLEIREKSVVISVEKQPQPMELKLRDVNLKKRQILRNIKENSQKQRDEVRQQLDILERERERLERERERLERQIEKLEREEEQSDEQRDEEQDSDAQSDTPESNSDSPSRQ